MYLVLALFSNNLFALNQSSVARSVFTFLYSRFRFGFV